MTRKAYTAGPNPRTRIWNSDVGVDMPVQPGQTVWVDLDTYRVDGDGDVKAYVSPDAPSLDYGYMPFTDLTPVSEVDDSEFNTETGRGYVKVGDRSVYLSPSTTVETLRSDADYYEKEMTAYRAVADWLEAREANDPVKKATAMLNSTDAADAETLAKYLIENGVVFP